MGLITQTPKVEYMKNFSEYLKTISQMNKLEADQTVEWLFHPGMLFLSKDKWWGDFKFRATAHEGIDICFFRDGRTKGKVRSFDPGIQVPALEDGRIINICNDFLGQTLVVESRKLGLPYTRVLITYAHIRPADSLKINANIKEKDIIARVCDTAKNPQLPPHLHLSCFEIPKSVQPEELNWTFFSQSTNACPINPIRIK